MSTDSLMADQVRPLSTAPSRRRIPVADITSVLLDQEKTEDNQQQQQQGGLWDQIYGVQEVAEDETMSSSPSPPPSPKKNKVPSHEQGGQVSRVLIDRFLPVLRSRSRLEPEPIFFVGQSRSRIF